MNRKRSELLVGLFLFLGLCLLGGMILKFGNLGDMFREQYTIELRYPTAGGLLEGSEVKFSGVTVGKVSEPPLPNDDFTGAIIKLSIFEEYPVPRGSKIMISTAGLLGDSYVSIVPPEIPSNQYLKDGDSVVGVPAGGLDALAESAGDLSEAGKEVVDDIRDAVSELNSALEKLDSSILGEENLQRFNEGGANLAEAIKSLNENFLGDENSENLRIALENFRKTSENFTKTSENLIVATEKIPPILEKAESAVTKADESLTSINIAAKDASKAIKSATEGDGLVAALINDKNLRADFAALISNLRDHGVLRYRDDADNASKKPPLRDRKGIFGNR